MYLTVVVEMTLTNKTWKFQFLQFRISEEEQFHTLSNAICLGGRLLECWEMDQEFIWLLNV